MKILAFFLYISSEPFLCCLSLSPQFKQVAQKRRNSFFTDDERPDCLPRRSLCFSAIGFLTGSVVRYPSRAESKEQADKEKLIKGYERLNYLLDHWKEETTVCGRNDNPYITKGGCERTPEKVMSYLGYKDMSDPLFRAEKTMRRLENLVPAGKEVEFLEAIDKFSQAADEGSGMAYVSSWGEANPGGGKDRVELFIERARKNVVDSRDSLAAIMDIVGIDKP
jgi:hypothetical protein